MKGLIIATVTANEFLISAHGLIVPKFAIISQRVSELLSRHDLLTEIYKGA